MADTCTRELEDGTLCGGRLAPAILGRHTGRWLRTCTRCVETITVEEPPEIRDSARPVIGFAVAHDLPLTWQQRHEEREP